MYGTLIAPSYVLTSYSGADNLTDMVRLEDSYVGIGQTVRAIRYQYYIESIYKNTDYIGDYKNNNIGPDFAIIAQMYDFCPIAGAGIVADNGLIDCQVPVCVLAVNCQIENCTNGTDDNGDCLIDCLEPQCATAVGCNREICNDQKDNSGNGMIDCHDPACADSEYCIDTVSASESCLASPKSPASPWGLVGLLMLGGVSLMRRRRV